MKNINPTAMIDNQKSTSHLLYYKYQFQSVCDGRQNPVVWVIQLGYYFKFKFMINKPGLSLDQVVISSMNCYFSEICEVSVNNQKKPFANQALNCHVSFNCDSLLIVTAGGNKFYLPLDQQISRVFPMVEGVLVEFFVKAQSKLQEILYYQKNKSSIDIQQNQSTGKYCYASLTRHPLNPIKILGELSGNNMSPWYKSKQKITYLSPQVPLMMTYNQQLNRNAIHLLSTNLVEIQSEYQYAYLPTQTYSLKNIIEFPHFEILAQTVYESNHTEDEVVDIRLTKSTKKNQIFIYALTSSNNLKVYEVDLYVHKQAVKQLKELQNCTKVGTCKLYPFDMFKPEAYVKGGFPLDIQIIGNSIEELDDIAIVVQAGQLAYLHRDRFIYGQKINFQVSKIEKSCLYDSNNQKIKIIPSFCQSHMDGMIIRTLELTLAEHENFAVFLNRYKSGQKLIQIFQDMQTAKLPIIQTLHTLCQQLRLYQTINRQRIQLSDLIIQLAKLCNKYDYVEYYLRQHYTSSMRGNINLTIPDSYQPAEEVVDYFLMMNQILLKSNALKHNIQCIFSRTNFIFNFLNILVNGETHINIEPFARNILSNSKQLMYRGYPLLSQKVFHIDYFNAIKQQEKLKKVKPESKEQKAFIYLIQNNQTHSDIMSYPQSIRSIFYWLLHEMRRTLQFELYEDIPELGFRLIHREDLYKNIQMYNKKKSIVPFYLKKPSFDEHIKTLVHTSTSEEYFLTSNASQMNKINNNLVFQQVDRLLSSSSEIKIKPRDIQSIPEHKWEAQSQNILLKFANRKVSVLVGQGAFSLGTSRSFITDIIKIPKINLNGIMPNQIKIGLDLKDDKQAIIHWPEFHSGMAAGLKLSRHVIPLSEDHLKTWIFYQKPDSPKRDHSGFLLSLGLLGYLKCFSPTDIYQYLKPNNEFTSVAILLGVSASNIGKSDENLSKTLVLHIPVLLPPSVDLQIPINVQTSALIGIGLLHKGTCNRTMTEMTLSQIGKKPCTDKCLDREGYSLAAGWALGMICLGMKDTKQSFRDLQLEQRLIRFIEGGRQMQPPQSMMSTNFVNDNKCSSIKQGPNVNLHITAPAALLAISLMYLKSNNSELASKISIPNSFNTIQQCNPNHILLKTIAKNLIMWDSITNSKQYMLKQIPELIRFIFDNSLKQVHEQYYLIYNVSEIDYQTITSIYASVLTGCAISMGLKYAGTGDVEAVASIKWHIEQLKSIRIIKCEFANDPLNKNCIDQYELFSLLSASILALSLVMAGTCDIQCLKIIRVVRKKFQDSKVFHYGFSMALNMAIGFIFLGYGNYTFNRQDMSVASLFISIFPQFPNSPTDNKWHLQALRHFYVLAMEQKIFHAVDVDTNKVVAINIEMQFLLSQGKKVKQSLNTPILLQESKKLMHVKIKDDDYFDVDFSFVNCNTDPKAIYIKRKHFKDISPALLNPKNVMSTQKIKQSILQNLNVETRYTSLFATDCKEDDLSYLLGTHPVRRKSIGTNASQKTIKQSARTHEEQASQKQIYYTLLKQDKLQMFEIYLNLKRQLKQFVQTGIYHSNLSANICLMLNFEKWTSSINFQNLVRKEINTVTEMLISKQNCAGFVKYLSNPYNVSPDRDVRLYKFMSLKNVPSARNIKLIKQTAKKLGNKNPQELQFMLYVAFPECELNILKFMLHNLN